ncbi:MAG: tRNA lysidine(34) synthetase TilS [Actinomycetaceae bacterium]|nr:tRNA lysidine(34) synthetase TilS [Actinomycetaceae bacterium]
MTPHNQAKAPASRLVGPKPSGSVKAVSLAVKTLLESALVKQVTTWVVGCSGGADSLALTVAAADFLGRQGKSCHALIVDHQMRPGSEAEAHATALQLEALQIPAHIVRAKVTLTGGLEAAARTARYRAFRDYLQENFPQETVGMLLGHTLDDQAETVLLSLARGAGTRALAGIRPHWQETCGETQIHFFRPFLEKIRRADTSSFCRQLGLTPATDPTNELDGPWQTAAGQPLPRVAVRHLVLPQLSQVLGQDVVPSLGRSAQLADEDATFLDNWAQKRYATGEFEIAGEVSVDALGKEEKPIRMRLWKLIFAARAEAMLTTKHLEELDRLVTNWRGQGPIALPGGWSARRNDRVEKTQRGKVWTKTVHHRIVLEVVRGLRENK